MWISNTSQVNKGKYVWIAMTPMLIQYVLRTEKIDGILASTAKGNAWPL